MGQQQGCHLGGCQVGGKQQAGLGDQTHMGSVYLYQCVIIIYVNITGASVWIWTRRAGKEKEDTKMTPVVLDSN